MEVSVNRVMSTNTLPQMKAKEIKNPKADETVVLAKRNEKQEAVKRVQAEFIKQVQSGKSNREAFFDSLKAMDKEEETDTFEHQKLTVGNCITPDQIKPWLELLAFTIPIIKSLLDLIPKGKKEKEVEQTN